MSSLPEYQAVPVQDGEAEMDNGAGVSGSQSLYQQRAQQQVSVERQMAETAKSLAGSAPPVLGSTGKSSQQPAAESVAPMSLLNACQMCNFDEAERRCAEGEDVNATDESQNSCLHWAANSEANDIVSLLISGGANVKMTGAGGQSALHWVCIRGYCSTAILLLDAGADSEARDSHGFTPIVRAAQAGHVALVKLLLLHGCDPCVKDNEGHNALHWAGFYGFTELCCVFLDEFPAMMYDTDEAGMTAGHIAARAGHVRPVQILVRRGLKLSEPTKGRGEAKTVMEFVTSAMPPDAVQGFKMSRCLPFFSHLFFSRDMRNPSLHLMSWIVPICAGLEWYAHILPTRPYLLIQHVLMTVLLPFFAWTFYSCAHINPGFQTGDMKHAARRLASKELTKDQVCRTCMIEKIPRSKHCGACGHCVEDMDHHCEWINNCVGKGNRVRFLMFLVSGIVLEVLFCSTKIMDMIYCSVSPNGPDEACLFEGPGSRRVLFALNLVVNGLFLFFIGAMNVTVLHNAITNVTTNERINWWRYSYLNDNGAMSNSNNLGVIGNLKYFFDGKTRAKSED